VGNDLGTFGSLEVSLTEAKTKTSLNQTCEITINPWKEQNNAIQNRSPR